MTAPRTPPASGSVGAPVHQLTRQHARRVAVQAQLLDAPRPTDLLDVVRRLTLLQLDPTAAVAPNVHLVAWSRLGSTYRQDHLTAALAGRRVVEHGALIRPAEDMRLYRAQMAAWPGAGKPGDWREARQQWLTANDACRRDILARLKAYGPLLSRELPDTCVQPWVSSGWTNAKNVPQLLELMLQRGEVAVAGRQGKERLWDLASRIYPRGPAMPREDAIVERDRRRLHALGIARSTAPKQPIEPNHVGHAGEPAEVDGVPGAWRVDPAYLDQRFTGRTALLSPFDRLVYDRQRASELFDFDFTLEMYKPASARRWGYFALPILHGDRLVGKLDATADRKAGVLRVAAIHEDVPFDRPLSAAVRSEIQDLAWWLELDVTG